MPSSRRRRRRRFLSNFKWPEDPLNLVEIKNPFGSFQTNPKADAWWVPPFFFRTQVSLGSDLWVRFLTMRRFANLTDVTLAAGVYLFEKLVFL